MQQIMGCLHVIDQGHAFAHGQQAFSLTDQDILDPRHLFFGGSGADGLFRAHQASVFILGNKSIGIGLDASGAAFDILFQPVRHRERQFLVVLAAVVQGNQYLPQ